ncbi:MAG: heme biosynthesis HemY N-terminal domain-containing protein [Pseudomonadota bacterium]
MIRILIFLLSVILVAGAVTYFAEMREWVRVDAFGSIVSFPAGLALGVGFVAFLLVIFFTAWFKDLVALPEKLRAREREAKRARGVAALTRGLEAVAVGDAVDAQHHARVAQRNLEDAALTRLLTAQAAQLGGDDKTAGESFTAMLEAPETEFLGLRGLYLKAMHTEDKATAAGYAQRAFKLRPNAKWAFESVFDLGLERGAWGETRDALAIALKNKIIAPEIARRADVALLTADAYAADLADNETLALEEAETALKKAPSFAPAAVLAAERHKAAGRRARGAKILEQAFAEAPHPGLVRAYFALFADAPVAERAAQYAKLAGRHPTDRDAKYVLARRHILLKEYAEAAAILEPLLMDKVRARDAAAMGEATAGAHGEEAARKWFETAADAPRDPTPGADGSFHFTKEGWARLVREYMHNQRFAPPPLEDAPRGLSRDEIKLLAPARLSPDAPSDASATSAGVEPGADPAISARAPARVRIEDAVVEPAASATDPADPQTEADPRTDDAAQKAIPFHPGEAPAGANGPSAEAVPTPSGEHDAGDAATDPPSYEDAPPPRREAAGE